MFVDNLWLTISASLNTSVIKRCLTTERRVACLLSGGLDSSLIASLVNNFYKLNKERFEENKNKVIKIKKSTSDVNYFNSLINKTF